jgi:hypothetical protein
MANKEWRLLGEDFLQIIVNGRIQFKDCLFDSPLLRRLDLAVGGDGFLAKPLEHGVM